VRTPDSLQRSPMRRPGKRGAGNVPSQPEQRKPSFDGGQPPPFQAFPEDIEGVEKKTCPQREKDTLTCETGGWKGR